MQEVLIRLISSIHAQKFVCALTPLEGEFRLISDNLILDARSFMGIFAFDLSRPIRLKIYNDSIENMTAIAPYRIDEEDKPSAASG